MLKKSDYENPIEHLDFVCTHATDEQEKLLRELLRSNANTSTGKKYHFSEIEAVDLSQNYRDNVPLAEFKDYEEYISLMRSGQSDILTSKKTAIYCLSSSGEAKNRYFPLVEEDLIIQGFYENDCLRALISRELGLRQDEIFANIFQLNEVFDTRFADGTLTGVRSGAFAWYCENNWGYDLSCYTSPREIFFPKIFEDISYEKIRFALEREDVTCIYGVFVYRTVAAFRFIERYWDDLIDDIEHGTINPKFRVSENSKDIIKKYLKPNPARANSLRQIDKTNLADGMLKKIWPRLILLRSITMDIYSNYVDALNVYAKGVTIHNFAYACTESNLGIALNCGINNTYALIPDACYFEFLPEKETDGSRTLTLSQVKEHERYELVITTLSGLYRYKIGDVVEVVGWYKNTPLIKICYRLKNTLSVADDNTNEGQFVSAMRDFLTQKKIIDRGFCIAASFDYVVPHYLVFIEADSSFTEEDNYLLDSFLAKYNDCYKACRNINDLICLRIKKLKKGSFEQYRDYLVEQGRMTIQSKPMRMLTEKADLDFFMARTENFK